MHAFMVRAVGAAALALAAGASAQPSFTPIGFLNDVVRESYAWGMSPDGQFVCGESSSASSGAQTEAFLRGPGGLTAMGCIAPSNFLSVANGVNNSGTSVGFSRYNPSGTLFQAFLTTDSSITASDAIGDIFGGTLLSALHSVSNNGTNMVGYGTYADAQGVSRRQAMAYVAPTQQIRAIGFLPGDNISAAYAISGDSLRAAGQSSSVARTRAILWLLNADTSIVRVELPDLPGGFEFAEAWGMSINGLVVVGDSESANGIEAVKWIDGAAIPLGDLPGGDFNSSANDASQDGSVIVGYGTSDSSGFLGEAVYWDAQGIHSIKNVLVARGIDLTGWDLQVATAVSGDGRVVVGNGIDPQGRPQGWVVTLPDPCPADFNGDGDVNPDDLGDFINCYFGNATTPGTCPQADFNGDGDANPDDLGDFINAFFPASVGGC